MTTTTRGTRQTTIFRSAITACITVSTVRTAPAQYETAIIVDGNVAEPRRSSSVGQATVEHDAACDFAHGRADQRSVSHAHWSREIVAVAA